MMSLAILAVLSVMGLAILVMARGQQLNRFFARSIARVLEEAFRPKDTEYRNIGGVVGYHFTFELEPPYRQLQGTMTFFPRHTLFYYPIARLLKREDELRLSISAEFFAVGEAHLASAERVESGWLQVADESGMDRENFQINGERFVLLYFYRDLVERMTALVRTLPDVSVVRHFACYGKERLFYFQLNPKLETLPDTLRNILAGLPHVADRY